MTEEIETPEITEEIKEINEIPMPTQEELEQEEKDAIVAEYDTEIETEMFDGVEDVIEVEF